MHFAYKKTVHVDYKDETTTGVDIRTKQTTWERIQNGLIVQLVTLQTENAKLKNLNGDNNNDQSKIAECKKNIYEAKVKADYFREWLRREGASVSKDGYTIELPTQKSLVVHDSDCESKMTRVNLVDGKLRIGGTKEDRTSGQILDTSKMVAYNSGPGYAIYVMSAQGNMYVHNHIVGEYHHSSLLAGASVACAGEIQVKDGKVTFISNKSGHYTPEAVHFNQALHMMDKWKQNNCTVEYFYTDLTDGKAIVKNIMFSGLEDYRKRSTQEEQDGYQVSKTFALFKWCGINDLFPKELEKWQWRCTDKVTGEKVTEGFYDAESGKMIPHEEARAIMKSLIGDAKYKQLKDSEIEVTLRSEQVISNNNNASDNNNDIVTKGNANINNNDVGNSGGKSEVGASGGASGGLKPDAGYS